MFLSKIVLFYSFGGYFFFPTWRRLCVSSVDVPHLQYGEINSVTHQSNLVSRREQLLCSHRVQQTEEVGVTSQESEKCLDI